MSASLHTLDLTPEELARAEAEVRLLAYQKWEEAGGPEDGADRFWSEAEREWIGRCYVPKRIPDGPCPHSACNTTPPETESSSNT